MLQLATAGVGSVSPLAGAGVPRGPPPRKARLLVTPMLAVPAVEPSPAEVELGIVAVRFVGGVGTVRSMVHVAVAGEGSTTPPAVASTGKLCAPAPSAE